MIRTDDGRFFGIVDELCGGVQSLQRPKTDVPLPNVEAVRRASEMLRAGLFPGYFGDPQFPSGNLRFSVGATLDAAAHLLTEQLERSLCFVCEKTTRTGCPECRARTDVLVDSFMETLPRLQKVLMSDVQAAYEGDPAATSPAETVFCYPGLLAITYQRIAHELYKLKVPLIPRMITEIAHSATGIDIHPGAVIGRSFFIDHGTGVVIGETSTIGERVRVYQGVTLGAKSFPLDEHGNPIKGIKRHPDVEDDVVIYAGATILGDVRIGKGSTIGGNVWLTHGVPPGSKIAQTGSDR
ncbi:MAG TPA: serine acetyltransferase [Elusimicrobia bacterium]|nr:serine acetyltransferase [Elusimicrobiota bacterium]HBT61293.1 serine acetyltransferase [Elusimicrobiota bacterium]